MNHEKVKAMMILFLGIMAVYALYLNNAAFAGTIATGFLALLNFDTKSEKRSGE